MLILIVHARCDGHRLGLRGHEVELRESRHLHFAQTDVAQVAQLHAKKGNTTHTQSKTNVSTGAGL